MDEHMFSSKVEQQTDTYTVTFYNGNVKYIEDTVTAGQPVNKPEIDPVRVGYNFAGWYRDSSCTIRHVFSEAVNGDISLYASWVHRTYHVRFDACEFAHPSTQVVVHGTYVLEPDVSYPGYIMEGWYTDETYTNRYNFNTKVTGPLCLYAKWIPL